MHSNYFVLITDENFGIFEISAQSYPQYFLENISSVGVVGIHEVEDYLIKELGRNILINKNFNLLTDIGKLYSRRSS